MLEELLNNLPQQGTVEWIGLRPDRRDPIKVVNEAQATTTDGLIGDRYSGSSGKRQITLIQFEHLPVIASCLNKGIVDPALLRRNIAVSGINLIALKGKRFAIGDVALEYTGLCHPCSFMDVTFGSGGYNAVRGHGGITARVISNGIVRVGGKVSVINTAL